MKWVYKMFNTSELSDLTNYFSMGLVVSGLTLIIVRKVADKISKSTNDDI